MLLWPTEGFRQSPVVPRAQPKPGSTGEVLTEFPNLRANQSRLLMSGNRRMYIELVFLASSDAIQEIEVHTVE